VTKFKQCKAREILRLVITFSGYTTWVFVQVTQAHSAWSSLCG